MASEKGAERAKAAQPGQAEQGGPPALSRRITLRALMLTAGISVLSFVIGLGAASQFMGESAPTASAGPSLNATAKDATSESLIPLEADSLSPEQLGELSVSLQAGDRLLIAGQPGQALRAFNALLEAQPKASVELRFRVALCAELLGDSERALNEYRTLMHETQRPNVALAAKMRQTQLLLQLSRPALARLTLWQDVLDPSAAGFEAGEADADFGHALALVLATEATAYMNKSLLADDGITFPSFRVSVDETLDLLNRPSSTDAKDRDAASDPHFVAHAETSADEVEVESALSIIQRLGPRLDDVFVRVRMRRMPLSAALDMISRQLEQPIHWSSSARESASGHVVQATLDDVDLATLLDGLLDPCDLAWQFADDKVQIFSYDELPDDAVRQLRISTAERALQRAIVAHPDHALVDEAYWSLGNLAFALDQPQLAQIHYQQYLRQFRRASGTARVHFNLAKAHLLLGNPQAAIDDFYFVIDSAPDEPISPAAYLFAGRLYLENDEASRAVKPLTRAVALARDQEQRATAVLTVAAAYLIDGKPHAANRILMEFREEFRVPAHFDQAAFLSALVRFRAAKFETQVEQEGRGLVNALSHVKPEQFFGCHSYLLIADAYRDLGLMPEMNEVLVAGIAASLPGALRDRMFFLLATCQDQAGNVSQAAKMYESLGRDAADPWRSRAELRLAQLALSMSDIDTAIAACHRLLARGEIPTPVEEVLRILGRVYQSQGDYEKAAMCFAGIAPDIPAPPDKLDANGEVQVDDREAGRNSTGKESAR